MLILLIVKEQDVCEGAAAIWQQWDEHDHARLYEVLTLLLTAASDLAVERQNN